MEKRGRGRPKKIAPPDNLDQKMVKCDEVLWPEFFKVYVAEIYSESMRIPPDFIENFGGNVPEIVTLIATSSEISFQVDVNKIEDCWFLENGWPEFVKGNSVEEGDFMTFSYAGNSVFYVRIFAINGCIKGICDVTDDEASESENSEDNQTNGRNLSPRIMPLVRNPICGNRSFSTVITKYCIHKGLLHIPSEFWRAHLRMDERGARMVTLWINQKWWNVSLASAKDRVVFARGLGRFIKDNSVRIGNVCTFQLLDNSDSAFNVNVEK